MLAELHIQNIAVIQQASIPFTHGLNVFTGETGAGKTILISALDAVLGERTSRDIIRSGEDKAQVSALFENISESAKTALEDLGYQAEDGSVLIFREITTAGRNTCRINGMPANVTLLKEVSEHLINIHGQRDTGQLLHASQHLKMIDDFGETQPNIKAYQEVFNKLQEKRHTLSQIDMDEEHKQQRIEMLEFQINEIELAGLEDPEEEDKLLAKRKIASGSEKIRASLSDALTAFSGTDEVSGLDEQFSRFLEGIENASHYMDEFSSIATKLKEIEYDLSDINREVQDALFTLDFNPAELDAIEKRLDVIYRLRRKYGDSVPEILEHYRASVEELESITLSGERKLKLEKEIKALEEDAQILAKKLSKKRAIACKRFIQQVEGELAFLDMPNVKLSVAHEVIPLSSLGTDQLEFMIITNIGEQPKPLGKIASGGELARIMLSIKNVLADKDDIDTLVFDEIDTGVSGKAAGKIGRKLAEVSDTRQVLCVTHLAQVAAFADNHLYIHKDIKDNRTYTLIDKLEGEESVKELARITSGEIISPAALESARELINRARSPYSE